MSVKSFVATLVPVLLFVAAASTYVSSEPQQCEWSSGSKSGVEYEACLTPVELADYLNN